MRHYCTLFDRNYLPRGLALQRSLLRHAGQHRLHVLCLDEPTRLGLAQLSLPNVELLSIADLEAWDPELRAARPGRKPAEFYFTCKPVLLAHILEKYADVERLTYLDSDLYFFAPDEALAGPVALSPHRFAAPSAHRERFGKYNAGWVSVDASAEARRFVQWWRGRCLEWCRLVAEETRFGDQKYLDQVPALFPGTVHAPRGVNAGPWNLNPATVRLEDGRTTLDGEPLVSIHFHGVRRLLFGLYDCGLHEYEVPLTRAIRDGIYRPYLRELAECERVGSSLASTPTPPSAVATMRSMAITARAVARQTVIHATA